MSRGENWLSAQVKRKLVKVKTILGKNKGGGRGHWNEVAQIQKLLVDEFNLTPFPVSAPSQDFMCFYRQNCSKHLSNYPVYILMHEIKGKNLASRNYIASTTMAYFLICRRLFYY